MDYVQITSDQRREMLEAVGATELNSLQYSGSGTNKAFGQA